MHRLLFTLVAHRFGPGCGDVLEWVAKRFRMGAKYAPHFESICNPLENASLLQKDRQIAPSVPPR